MAEGLAPTLGDIIEINARRFGDRTAFAFGEREVSHSEFYKRSLRLSSALHRIGMRRQDRASILAQNCMEFLEVFGAGEVSGIIIATVNFRLAGPEVLYILNDTAPRVMFFESAYAETIDRLRADLTSVKHYVCIASDSIPCPGWAIDYATLMESGDESGSPYRAQADDIAYLIYTSGTTGRPKGCIEGHREVWSWAHSMCISQRSDPWGRALLVMPFFHVGAKFVQLAQHICGGTVYVQRGFNAARVLSEIDRHRITLIHLAPMMVQALFESDAINNFNLRSLKTVLYGAAPMALPVLKKGLELLGPVFTQTYGQTETLGAYLAHEEHRPDGTDDERRWLHSLGHAYVGMKLKIVSEKGHDCSIGEPGEIAMFGSAKFRGYWNNSVGTAETLRDGWVFTGDIGRIEADGFVYLVDRKKDMIISGGENIYSREVEIALAAHAGVAECAVIGIPDSEWGESVCAIVVLKVGAAVSEQELIDHCKTQIASYKKPKSIVFVQDIPRLPSGKISKTDLRMQYSK